VLTERAAPAAVHQMTALASARASLLVAILATLVLFASAKRSRPPPAGPTWVQFGAIGDFGADGAGNSSEQGDGDDDNACCYMSHPPPPNRVAASRLVAG
jgi:hypothetical protein